MKKKEENEEEEEVEVPKPAKDVKENKEETPRVLVVGSSEEIPRVEVRDAEYEGKPVKVETITEALTEMRNDVKTILETLVG